MNYIDEIAQEITEKTAGHYSIDSEESVIGALLQGEPDTFTRIQGKVTSEDFFKHAHRVIFSEMEDMYRERIGIDLITLAERLGPKLDKVGGLAYLNDLYENTPTTANAPIYAKFVRDHSIKRKALSIANELTRNIRDNNAISEAIRSLMRVDSTEKKHNYNIKQVLVTTCDAMQDALEGKTTSITTGLKSLDGLLGGFYDSDLIVLGARPSHGKTALALNFMEHCGVPCGLISTEQPAVQIGLRMLAINGRLDAHAARAGKLNQEEWAKVSTSVQSLQSREIYINDESSPSLDSVVNQARQWAHEHGIKILFVDYLQRIQDEKKGEDGLRLQIRRIVMQLKTLARELNIPVVVLAQVNRAVEQRSNKRPGMGDLMESGAIEAEADVVMTLYRDEVYDPDSADAGIAELLICKNRAGPTGFVRTAFIGHSMRFENMVRL